jgi:hypothetical protein
VKLLSIPTDEAGLSKAFRVPRHHARTVCGSLSSISNDHSPEIGVRHAPKPAVYDEGAAVRRHRMLHDTLGKYGLF